MIEYLENYDANLKPFLHHTTNISDILNIVQDKCTLIDITYMEAMVIRFNIEGARTHIESYKTMVDQFCQSAHVCDCLEKTLSIKATPPPLKDETIIVVLKWDPNNCTLRDITNTMSDIFPEGYDKWITIKNINKGSIIVTCSFPLNVLDPILDQAQKTKQIMREKLVTRLTLGDYTILELDEVNIVVPNIQVYAIFCRLLRIKK